MFLVILAQMTDWYDVTRIEETKLVCANEKHKHVYVYIYIYIYIYDIQYIIQYYRIYNNIYIYIWLYTIDI